MKKLLTVLIAIGLTLTSSFGFNELDKNLNNFYTKNNIKIQQKAVDDYTMVRRIYIDFAGRIPTLEEIKSYVSDKAPNKRETTIDKILNSEDYVNNYYNFWADILRIRPERLADDVGLLKSYPYMEYVRNVIRTDKPYNEFVNDLLTAEGKFTENPATGYILRDNGMQLDNLATTLQLFVGKDVACAQCHDDPFQDYSQMDFYKMAAFFAPYDNREARKEYGETLKRIDAEIKSITGKDRVDNNVRQLMSSNLFKVHPNAAKTMKLPHDYKYSDAKPFDVVSPVAMDGRPTDASQSPKQAFASWVTSHPDFGVTLVNRIWDNIVGIPMVAPITNFDLANAPTKDVAQFLGEYVKTHNYSIKSVLKLIGTSDFYGRAPYAGKLDEYKLQGLIVKRMTSYQVWDSVLALIIPDANYTRISFGEYAKVVNIDYSNAEVLTGQGLLDQMQRIRDYDAAFGKNFLKYKNIDLVRSCFLLNRNNFVGTFLKEFGSSDRVLIDASTDSGSITQILVLMNSPLTNLISDKNSQIVQAFEKHAKDKRVLFVSLLSRPPTVFEGPVIEKVSMDDIIWSIVNSREFLFRK